MQYNKKMVQYGPVMISITALIAFIYIITTVIMSSTSSSTAITSADYAMSQSQSPFKSNMNNDTQLLDCNCLQPNSKTTGRKKNTKTIKDTIIHGEDLPVLVPETLPSIPADILEKINDNRYHDDNDHDSAVLITVASYEMRYQVYNWIRNLNEMEETQFVIFCTDYRLYVHLIVAGYEAQAVLIPDDWLLETELTRNETLSIESEPRTTHVKTWILQRLIYTDGLIMMVDIDAIFVRSRAKEYLTTLMNIRHETHLIATQDSLDQRTANTGIIMLRGNSRHLKRVLANTIQIQEAAQPYLTQQDAFNKALNKMELHVKTGMYVMVDVMHFPNGIVYFENNLSKTKGIKPYIIHANNKIGQEKVEMLKEHGLWVVDEGWVDSHNDQVKIILERSKISTN